MLLSNCQNLQIFTLKFYLFYLLSACFYFNFNIFLFYIMPFAAIYKLFRIKKCEDSRKILSQKVHLYLIYKIRISCFKFVNNCTQFNKTQFKSVKTIYSTCGGAKD